MGAFISPLQGRCRTSNGGVRPFRGDVAPATEGFYNMIIYFIFRFCLLPFMILEQTYELLQAKYAKKIENLFIKDVVAGIYLTAIRLSDNTVGMASTLPEKHPFCGKHERDFGEFTPLKIKGRRVADLLLKDRSIPWISSLQTAAVNAISSGLISSGRYNIIEDTDPVNLLDLSSKKTITLVGAFQSYIKEISAAGNKLYVLEFNESAFPENQKKYYVPATEYEKVIPISDIVIITGQALVNNTISDLLNAVSNGTRVIVTGPSGSILPDVLFANKVNIIGCSRIVKPGKLFELISQGGKAYHLYEYHIARKICITRG